MERNSWNWAQKYTQGYFLNAFKYVETLFERPETPKQWAELKEL